MQTIGRGNISDKKSRIQSHCWYSICIWSRRSCKLHSMSRRSRSRSWDSGMWMLKGSSCCKGNRSSDSCLGVAIGHAVGGVGVRVVGGTVARTSGHSDWGYYKLPQVT